MNLDDLEASLPPLAFGKRGIRPGDGDRRHGTVNGYSNLKCRCEACTEAWRLGHHEWERVAMRAGWRRLRRDGTRALSAEEWDQIRPKAEHGSVAMAKKCTAGPDGSRCEACRRASADARREFRGRTGR